MKAYYRIEAYDKNEYGNKSLSVDVNSILATSESEAIRIAKSLVLRTYYDIIGVYIYPENGASATYQEKP